MAERVSALDGHYETGRSGEPGEAGVTLQLMRDLTLSQVAAWPDTLAAAGAKAAKAVGAKEAPGPCASAAGKKGVVLRIEPLKWWIVGASAPKLDPKQGSSLDLSHSRTRVRVSGPEAATFLNRFIPLDLRDQSFPAGTVASTAMHHVGVTLWRSEAGYELLLPRGFALSLWEVMVETAAQFGCDVK